MKEPIIKVKEWSAFLLSEINLYCISLKCWILCYTTYTVSQVLGMQLRHETNVSLSSGRLTGILDSLAHWLSIGLSKGSFSLCHSLSWAASSY